MPKTKVLIAVKTYPALSKKYDELVCTAGFLPDGTWIRIFPIKFRSMDYINQYKKYDWIEIDLLKNEGDIRKESYRPRTIDEVPTILSSVGTQNNWAERKETVLRNVYTNLTQLIEDSRHSKQRPAPTSLAVFKPARIVKFECRPCERQWDAEKLQALKQQSLFEPKGDSVQVVKKLPYTFHYTFEDEAGRQSTLMIEDWEIGALYWNCLRSSDNDERLACEKVRAKYMDEFTTQKDLYFFLGTRLTEHVKNYPNPFSIIGVFCPKKDELVKISGKPKSAGQLELF
ncbi:hypothetical protein [Hymenobacter fodinae]|uniref:Uncharacterized protein n=1 Tax=Hymenobacter fodinae TaxID=2510796 RepID=A0A4Z0P378_9BACT|nr:hypothetical protein [Hymenobacter fodinae]TGE06104.1 hypothetical protein EU556_14650 [Hymenobacter fodinae]